MKRLDGRFLEKCSQNIQQTHYKITFHTLIIVHECHTHMYTHAHKCTVTTIQVLTGGNSPHQFPGDSGEAGVWSVITAQICLHQQQHDQQSDTKQTQHHITDPGFRDLVEGVVNLQEEVVGNTLEAQNILETHNRTAFNWNYWHPDTHTQRYLCG